MQFGDRVLPGAVKCKSAGYYTVIQNMRYGMYSIKKSLTFLFMSFSSLAVLSIMCSKEKNGNFSSPSSRKLRNEVGMRSRFFLSVNLQSLLNLHS
jgi:hypothetical protein